MGATVSLGRGQRTAEQVEADDIDLQVFRALSRIEDKAAPRGAPKEWREAAQHLRVARARIRRLMHPEDVKRTEES